MIMKVYLIAVIASLCEALNYTDTHIPGPKSGLHYELVGEVRFTTAEWKFVTYINMQELESQRPVVTKKMLTDLLETCLSHTFAKECSAILRHQDLLQKSEFVTTLLKELNLLLTKSLMDDQSSKQMDGYTPTSYIHHIHEELYKMKNRTAEAADQLERAFKAFETANRNVTQYLVVDAIETWKLQLQLELNFYIDFLQAIMDSVLSVKLGVIHPKMFSFENLGSAVDEFVEQDEYKTFVFPSLTMDDVNSGKLLKISTASIVYAEGKLLVVFNIPLLYPAIYELYKIYPYPVPQSIGYHHGGSAYIQPRADFVLLSKRHYTLLSAEDLFKCPFIDGIYICTPKGPLFNFTLHPACEAAVIMMKKQPFTDCDVKVSLTFESFWIRTGLGWLYSLSEKEAVDIHCDGNLTDTVELSGVGILQLQPGCQAHTSYAVMIGYRDIMNISLESNSSENLNVTMLMPAVERISVLPPDYIDLKEVRREIKQMDYHAKEYKRQISIYFILLIGQVLFGIAFFCLLPIVYNRTYIIAYEDIPV